MKYVILSHTESSKIDFSGCDGLSKADHIVFVYVKGKKALPAKVSSSLEDAKTTVDYVEIGAATELWATVSYLIGFHAASKHEVIVVTSEKGKIPSRVAKDAKILTSFNSFGGTSSASSKKTTAKKTSTAKKTTAKKTTTAKKSTTTKKASTTKKTATKKTAAKKKDDGLDVGSILTSISKGDTKKLTKEFTNLANQIMKGKK